MKPEWQKEIAKERIEILFNEAGEIFSRDKERANRYVEIARNLAMSYRITIPQKFKRKFCGECHSYLKHGDNCVVEINSEDKVIEYTCEECGNIKRYPYEG